MGWHLAGSAYRDPEPDVAGGQWGHSCLMPSDVISRTTPLYLRTNKSEGSTRQKCLSSGRSQEPESRIIHEMKILHMEITYILYIYTITKKECLKTECQSSSMNIDRRAKNSSDVRQRKNGRKTFNSCRWDRADDSGRSVFAFEPNPQPGGPDPYVYIPQWQGGLVIIPPRTGIPFRRLMRPAGQRRRYCNRLHTGSL